MLSVIMLSVIMLTVVMLNVVAPQPANKCIEWKDFPPYCSWLVSYGCNMFIQSKNTKRRHGTQNKHLYLTLSMSDTQHE
jgi:hypothetical protein